jgi:hypothetical protein
MKSDLSDRVRQKQFGFGVAYEVLIYEGNRFRYLTPVVYAAMGAQVDSAGHIIQMLRPWGIALMRNIGEHTICQIGRNLEGVMDIDLVEPPWSSEGVSARARLQRTLLTGPFVFEGQYCVLFTQFVEGTRLWPPAVGIIPHGSAEWVKSDKRGVQISTGALQGATIEIARLRRGRW